MGGTFGCIGSPLTPMPAHNFLEKLSALASFSDHQVHYFAAPSIKDSTELMASDWLLLAQFIKKLMLDFEHFIVIHGTDTLSYASAFLHHIFNQDIHLIITGSQQPLLTQQGDYLREKSDAVSNYKYALEQVMHCNKGVYLAFAEHLHIANQSYKQDTEAFNAFLSNSNISSTSNTLPKLNITTELIEKTQNIRCLNIYILPQNSEKIALDLAQIAQDPPEIIILQGFGSGNLPYSKALEHALKHLVSQGTWVIISTQVLFGPITQKYATGSWLNNINLVFDPHYSQADLYARAVLLYLQYGDQKNWQQYWV